MTCWPAEVPEGEPETGYSSIGGMLPYWVLPQGSFYDDSPPLPQVRQARQVVQVLTHRLAALS